MRTTISADKLARQFDGVSAVDEIDLDIQQGEIYGFLGPNGAGKSTTVRMLCTLLAPTSGRAVVAGHDVATHPGQVRLAIGVALQEAALDPKQTGVELLRLQGRLYGLSRAEIDQRLADLATLVDIGDALNRRIATYSGGMKRGLDPVSRARVWEEVRRLNRELDMTIFLTTQYLEEADELADRVGIINEGKLVAEGTPFELKRRIGNDVIFARLDGDASGACPMVEAVAGVAGVEPQGNELVITAAEGTAVIGPVAVALNKCGIPLRDLTLRTPTLDDVFLELTGTHIQTDESIDDEFAEMTESETAEAKP